MFELFLQAFDEYLKEHPEIIEEIAKRVTDQFVDVKDIALGDAAIFTVEKRICDEPIDWKALLKAAQEGD